MIAEAAQIAVPVSHAKELYAIAGVIVIQLGTVLAAHRKGKQRAPELGRELDKRFMPLDIKIDSLSDEVRDLKAHVIGPDGQNGLRGDVRELKYDVKGILDRERDAKLHGPYRP